ncbi:MAG: hypothetical protein LDL53_09120 [Candidatus Hydrogenedens sp.]|nr:hypothetical protein [Candidatus Hydrogenedens sp.]
MTKNSMFIMFATVAIIAQMLCVVSYGVEATIAKDRMLIVNGQRTFILGLYSPKTDDPNELQMVADAGFNLISISPSEEQLNVAKAHNLMAWANIHSAIASSDAETRKQELMKLINLCSGHPSFFVWEMPDEALWNIYLRNNEAKRYKEPQAIREKLTQITDEKLKEDLTTKLQKAIEFYSKGLWAEGEGIVEQIWQRLGETSPFANYSMADIERFKADELEKLHQAYQIIKEVDPKHPVWANHAPRNSMESLRKFSACADIVGCDIYPVPMHPKLRHSDLMDQTMASVGAYTRRMQEIDPQKPVWMVIQGFDWGMLQGDVYERSGSEQKGFRPPTLNEIRFMGFDCIVNGARGILFWGTHYVPRDMQLWSDLLTFAKEIKSLQPVLSAEDASQPVSITQDEIFGSGDRGVLALVKIYQQHPWILLVNEWHECGIRYHLSSPYLSSGQKYREYYTQIEVEVKDNTLTYGIEPHNVQVWQPVE